VFHALQRRNTNTLAGECDADKMRQSSQNGVLRLIIPKAAEAQAERSRSNRKLTPGHTTAVQDAFFRPFRAFARANPIASSKNFGRLRHPLDSRQAKFDHDLTTAWGRIAGENSMSSNSKTPDRDEAPRRRRAWRFLVKTSAIVLILGAGWIAGSKTQERLDLDQLASAASTRMAEMGALLGASGTRLLALVQDEPADRTAPPEPSSTLVEKATSAAGDDGNVERISLKLDEVRASSEAAVEGLRGTVDRVASSIDSHQRQLVVKLEDFSDRLARLERNGSEAAGPVLTRLALLNERLERIERSVPVALAPTQPAAPTNGAPSAKAVTAPVQASTPVPPPQTAEKTQAPAETKKIANWVVREVINGTAILQSPRGVIGVSVGDFVPGVGRVQSIARQGGRWIVATNKGVITAR
jgi:hypothetical protein